MISFEGNVVCLGTFCGEVQNLVVVADNTFIDLLLAPSLLYDIFNCMIVKNENPTTTG